jgi:ABC-type multidrug transport system fused ATPase/permease subunit
MIRSNLEPANESRSIDEAYSEYSAQKYSYDNSYTKVTRSKGFARFREVAYFLSYLKPDRFLVSGVILLSVLSSLARLPLMYLPTILTAHFETYSSQEGVALVTDWLAPGLWNIFGEDRYLLAAVIIALAGMLLLAPFQLIRSYWSSLVGGNLLLRIRTELFGNLQRLTMLSVYERGAGPFVQRITRDMFIVHDLLIHTLTNIINLILQIIIILIVLLVLNYKLTLVVLAAYLLLLPLLSHCNRGIQIQSDLLQQLHEQVTTQIIESIGGFRDIVAVGRFEKFAEQFRLRSKDLRHQSIRSVLWSQYGELVLNLAFGALTVVPYFLLVQHLETVVQVGQAITYVGLLSILLPSLAGLWGITVELSSATPSLYSLRDFLRRPEALSPIGENGHKGHWASPPSPPLPTRIDSIRFEGVGLQLDGRWIVRDLTFTIEGGRLTALVGQSGSGKTTIFHLLLRLIHPSCGTIFVNDIPLDDFAEGDVRQLLGFIPQNPFIFNTSLRENLLVAEAPVGDKALLDDVVDAAQLRELVQSRSSEGGIDSSAGYMGMRLSGGERQRVALGRLLVQNPKIIICDEYTANIDIRTTQLIQEMMRTRFADRTRLVITHELYNTKGAHKILVIDQGHIVQSGTHQQLAAIPGIYHSMWESQRLDYID